MKGINRFVTGYLPVLPIHHKHGIRHFYGAGR